MYENGNAGTTASTGFTAAVVDRLQLLNLVDGAVGTSAATGTTVYLAGLGVKTGAEAVRLGINAVVPAVVSVQQKSVVA